MSLTVNQILPVAPGTPLTWSADANGGTAPLQYRFWLYDVTTDTWTLLQDWSVNKTYTWTSPAHIGGRRSDPVACSKYSAGRTNYDLTPSVRFFVQVPTL